MKKIILTAAFLVLTFSGTLFLKVGKTDAAFSIGDIVSINIKQFVTEVIQSFAEVTLDSFAKRYANQFVTKALNTYHIGNIANYGLNLSNQVYLYNQLQDKSAKDQYILRAMSNDINGLPVQHGDLTALLNQSSLQYYNISNISKIPANVNANIFLAQAGNFRSTPFGQQQIYLAQADQLNSRSLSAAASDIANGKGIKSSYACGSTQTNSGTSSQQINCAIKSPGAYVSGTIDSTVSSIFQTQNNPPANHLAQIAARFGNAFAGIFQQALLNNGASNHVFGSLNTNTNIINNINNGISNQINGNGAKATLQMFDANGNQVASAGASISAPNGTYTLTWSATNINGAKYVGLTPCTNNCVGAQLPLNSTLTVHFTGSVQTFNIEVFGANVNGNPIPLDNEGIVLKQG